MDDDLIRIDRHLGGNNVGAHFVSFPSENISGVALDPDAPEQFREVYLAESQAYKNVRLPKNERVTMADDWDGDDFDAHLKFDPNRLLALRCTVEDFFPSLVAEVIEACTFANHPRVIQAYCQSEPSLNAVVAIVENLKARGEIPAEEEEQAS